MFCARPRYQVSVYRTIGPLVLLTHGYPAGVSNKHCLLSLFSFNLSKQGYVGPTLVFD